MKKLSAILILLPLLLVTGCGGGSSSRVVEPVPENYVPELLLFDLVDSYGDESADYGYEYEYEIADESVFDVFWEANSLEDYTVNLYLNDASDPRGGILIHSQICGAGRRCDQGGGWICDYFDDSMSCDDSGVAKNVAPLTRRTPHLYLVLSICDLDSPYCEYDHFDVFVE